MKMARRKLGSSVPGRRAVKSAKDIRDSQINFSDIPELSDTQLKSMRRVGRPPLGKATKQLIALRLEPQMIEQLRSLADKEGIGYQTLINDILQGYLKKKPA
jgi:uncharacterized protein (DUF4415 family)